MLNKPRMLTPGPTPIPAAVRLAMAQDMIHHRKPAFKAVMAETQRLLRPLFGTAQPVLPLSCSGTGAMTAAVTNLFSAGEKVVVVEGGKFGQRWTEIARSHGLVPVVIEVPWGSAVTAQAVKQTLEQHGDAAGVLVQCSETSTGVMHPVREIAAVTRSAETLLVVDGISSVGLSPCPMDEWGVDCLLTGSQKGLMLPPGLALIALSERAWARTATVTPSCFYFNLRAERKNAEADQTLFTTPVSLIIGLRESLRMYEETGLEEVFRKQWALTQMARTGVSAMGLAPFVAADYGWGLTSIALPGGIDGTAVLAHAAQHYGVIMAGGQDHLKGRIIRMGHMGWVDWGDIAAGLHALAESYRACGGYIGCRDYIEQALQAYNEALLSYAENNPFA
ncbi:pyridoxal-phosphate-dependent aminotransferase family protein [Oleidesulfovibrio alaskensis]|jgi:aspartate aminotransferase-like enzyme|uniref:pyridoxal-phosphate-dependent aminotransferase family protein n=1 Tax=Oleidesulfovibrio alaskensis TaxID=58180 RepID=UPI000414C682|nr:alanine--glyoxylate aminotransferase family protein [Oleidesulfovibrio alaskensis]